MRHRIKGRKLNRTASHRKSLIRNLANQLFEYKEIRTTTAKAKEARITIERLITYAKKGDTHHRRLAFSFLRQKESIKTLFDEIAPTYTDRQGGYTRVVKLGRRQGDGAPMALLQLVGFETLADTSKPEKKKKSRKKEDTPVETATKTAETKEPAAAATPQKEMDKEEAIDGEGKKVEEPDKVENVKEDSKDSKKVEPAEEIKTAEKEKPVEKSDSVEEKTPVENAESVEEAPIKIESEEKPPDEAKNDDIESGEEKKEK